MLLYLPSLFLVRVARYANHFSSLLGSTQNPILPGAVFIQQPRHETNFLLPSSRSCCYSTGQCCCTQLPGQTVFLLSFVRPSIFWLIKNAQNALFWAAGCSATGCCSTTAEFVFLVRVARYANHFSSLLGSPKIPFCRVQFLSSRTSRMRLIFCQPTSRKSMLL